VGIAAPQAIDATHENIDGDSFANINKNSNFRCAVESILNHWRGISRLLTPIAAPVLVFVQLLQEVK
jgi:hypothetical protein